MPSLNPDSPLARQYRELWDGAEIQPRHKAAVQAAAARILAARHRYEALVTGRKLPVPAWFVGVLHSLEAGCDFGGHLHNGDPLKARTRNVPAGRPPLPAKPPFAWEDSAADALTMPGKEYLADGDWSIAGTLYKAERYNGLGYLQYHKAVMSPYVWGMTTLYDCAPRPAGKYRADGKWSATLVSKQAGAAALLMHLVNIGSVKLRGGRFV